MIKFTIYTPDVVKVLHAVLSSSPSVTDLVCFAQFTAVTIPTPESSQTERDIDIQQEWVASHVDGKKWTRIQATGILFTVDPTLYFFLFFFLDLTP